MQLTSSNLSTAELLGLAEQVVAGLRRLHVERAQVPRAGPSTHTTTSDARATDAATTPINGPIAPPPTHAVATRAFDEANRAAATEAPRGQATEAPRGQATETLREAAAAALALFQDAGGAETAQAFVDQAQLVARYPDSIEELDRLAAAAPRAARLLEATIRLAEVVASLDPSAANIRATSGGGQLT